MATANVGVQKIGWKFSTPLQADYLNTFIAGFSSQGLLTRPKMQPTTTSYGADVTIQPFSLLIVPEDTIPNGSVSESTTDEDGNILLQKLVKITTTTQIKISITEQIVALGFKYSFTEPSGSTQSQWYGEVVALAPDGIADFKGIIIATCQNYKPQGEPRYFSVKTNGADISDFLLMKEGRNPLKWLSVISPRRVTDGIYYNKLEVRTHNDSYNGYINGHNGVNQYKNLTYTLNTNVEVLTNPNGTRGIMPGNFNVFRLQTGLQIDRTVTEIPVSLSTKDVVLYLGVTTSDYTNGHCYQYDTINSKWNDVTPLIAFRLSEYSNALPIEKTSGGIFAIVDASLTNQKIYSTAFTNNLTIKPVQEEDINIYYDNNTLFIK